jgi:hypothetical protein
MPRPGLPVEPLVPRPGEQGALTGAAISVAMELVKPWTVAWATWCTTAGSSPAANRVSGGWQIRTQ